MEPSEFSFIIIPIIRNNGINNTINKRENTKSINLFNIMYFKIF